MSGSHCLRKKIMAHYYETPKTIDSAKNLCSKDNRCAGIESEYEEKSENKAEEVIRLCIVATYTSTAWDKYQNSTNLFFRKAPNYGKYALLLVTKEFIVIFVIRCMPSCKHTIIIFLTFQSISQ